MSGMVGYWKWNTKSVVAVVEKECVCVDDGHDDEGDRRPRQGRVAMTMRR